MAGLLAELPETLRSLRTAPLFVRRLAVPKVISVGATPGAFRVSASCPGGSSKATGCPEMCWTGETTGRISATTARRRSMFVLRLRTNDGALIAMTYRGVRHGPADVLARIDKGEAVDPQS